MNIFEHKSRIQFCDVDEFNHLSKRGLLRILGEVAGLHSDLAGYGLNQTSSTHLTWMLLDWKVKTFLTPCWNTTLTIKTWPRNFTRISSQRDFEVYGDNNELVAIASSRWVLINSITGSISKITPEMISAYGNGFEKSVFDSSVNDKEHEPTNANFVYNYTIKRRDLDTNHHVNNLYYLDYAYDALPQDCYNQEFDNIEIIYKQQIKYNALINCFYHYDSEKKQHIVIIKNDDLSITHSIIKFYKTKE